MLKDINPPLGRPPLSRDPYDTPLSPKPPKFMVTSKITQGRFELISFEPPGWLSEEEKSLLMSVIGLREKGIALSAEERGLLKHSYGKPYKIPLIPHTPWKKKPIPIPKPIIPQFIEVDLNKVTIKDAGLPQHIEEFVDAFSGRACYGLGDIMGGYDERELETSTRPLTKFETPLGRLKLTGLPQGETNSVAVY
ncbi:hypothetical protein O181_121053 [Austropuccinia psidii MF-1]|uniref:Uncharacterized protein n=1 Tax=Austropuccinia psidii MF-1 TaxID=1389203 RepID=A0A9Q3KGU2_9BASI|nr:hypothetical protein [Austropuccinia psidii MF-1]